MAFSDLFMSQSGNGCAANNVVDGGNYVIAWFGYLQLSGVSKSKTFSDLPMSQFGICCPSCRETTLSRFGKSLVRDLFFYFVENEFRQDLYDPCQNSNLLCPKAKQGRVFSSKILHVQSIVCKSTWALIK